MKEATIAIDEPCPRLCGRETECNELELARRLIREGTTEQCQIQTACTTIVYVTLRGSSRETSRSESAFPDRSVHRQPRKLP